MKKKVVIGVLAGMLVSVLLVVIYFAAIVGHKNNVIAETTEEGETTVVYEPQETTIAYVPPETVVETEQQVSGYTIVYGDNGENVFIPEDSFDSVESLMGVEGVSGMLHYLLFDINVEFDMSSYAWDGNAALLRGDSTAGDGYVLFFIDTAEGTCEMESFIKTDTVQTRDDYIAPGSTHVTNYGSGIRLDDINSKTVSTVKVDVKDIVDWDTALSKITGSVPDTLKVVTKGMSTQDEMISTYLGYMYYYFGEGEIVIWDYEKPQYDIVVVYATLNGWNVAVQLRAQTPTLIHATAQKANEG